MMEHTSREECTVFAAPSLSELPSLCAVRTFTPAPIPIRNPVNSDTSSVVEPTAPSAI